MAARQADRLVPELAQFEGLWRLEREVIHDVAPPARFDGEARFTPVAEGLTYHEVGQLQIHGQASMQAERSYAWRARAGGGIDVFFEDGRFFHSITGAGEAEHWCAPDMYAVTYDFGAWPDWSSIWQVRGPRKAYRMISRYAR